MQLSRSCVTDERRAEGDTEDLLEPLRSLGWTASVDGNGDLRLDHPLEESLLHADTPEDTRRMLADRGLVDGATYEWLREHADTLVGRLG